MTQKHYYEQKKIDTNENMTSLKKKKTSGTGKMNLV